MKLNNIIEKIKIRIALRNEKNFIKYLREKGITIGEKCHIAVTDVSFISQTLIIPSVERVLREDGI